MATNHTTNYQLNLWEPTDAFLREEFNENFQKLDTALGALEQNKSGFVKLKEYTTTEDTKKFQINVTDIDWGRWQYVLVDMKLLGGGYVNFYVNNEPEKCSSYTGSSGNSKSLAGDLLMSYAAVYRTALECFRTPGKSISAITGNVSGKATDILFSQVTTFDFEVLLTNYTIRAGSKITVWGVS